LIEKPVRRNGGKRMDERVNEYMNGCMDGWMHVWMNEFNSYDRTIRNVSFNILEMRVSPESIRCLTEVLKEF
jgi:hypothetical protein